MNGDSSSSVSRTYPCNVCQRNQHEIACAAGADSARQVLRLPEGSPFAPSISWLAREVLNLTVPTRTYSSVALARSMRRRSIDGMGNYMAEGAGEEEELRKSCAGCLI
eukprot:118814-Hanusia_phi.AAC.1